MIWLLRSEQKGRLVGAVVGGQQPANDQVTKNVGAYIRFVDGGNQVTQFAASLDQVVDSILTETATQAKAAINAKLGGTLRTVQACSAQLAKIDTLVVRFLLFEMKMMGWSANAQAGATNRRAIATKWAAVKAAALARG